MSYKYLIQSNNIHSGGGETLLNSLLQELDEQSCVFIDERKELSDAVFHFEKVKPSLLNRFYSEYAMKKLSNKNTNNLIFTNLPPFFKLKGKTVLFIQNVKLLHFGNDKNYGVKVLCRLYLERLWLRFFIRNVDRIIVQSTTVKSQVQLVFGNELDIKVTPFAPSLSMFFRGKVGSYENLKSGVLKKFLYVASGEPHKNHKRLIEAWIILANKGIYPLLSLTLDIEKSKKLVEYLNDCTVKYKLNIKNLGWLPQSKITATYSEYDCLVYPSKMESFGIPLIEARTCSIDIIASELDYVRELVDPEETFNPDSAASIARAVCRYSSFDYQNTLPIESKDLLNEAFSGI
ncbi:glycosyltransferase [Shewanella sp. SR43-4]|uniref:glycosyltransferase n=1 Tax=Shewanella sp. SR43-4 TaxID=2760942 RepID=UPI0015F99641|nr:glycosyltransferase [Shewanella sp. SR43-4]MBB1318430.1 glycosyltransferase [Shewanella sp. SR43-4]